METTTNTDNTVGCTGNVTRQAHFPSTPTDSNSWRSVDVAITRCDACAGSAVVRDEAGNVWIVELPEHDYRTDDGMAAYWAAEVTAHRAPHTAAPVEAEAPYVGEYDEDDSYVEDEDGSLAYARMLERRSEQGRWF